ncbi:MAG: hypothetical protein AAF517_13125, partial [Planctomycetota bacterium]
GNPAFEGFTAQDEVEASVDPDAARPLQRARRPNSYRNDYENDPESPLPEVRPNGGIGTPSPDLRGTELQGTPPTGDFTPPNPGKGGGTSPGGSDKPFWKGRGLQLDKNGKSWFLPLRGSVSNRARVPRGKRPPAVETGWLGGGP